jgi:hypothetical protein
MSRVTGHAMRYGWRVTGHGWRVACPVLRDVCAMRDACVRDLAVTSDARDIALAVVCLTGSRVWARAIIKNSEAVRFCPVLSSLSVRFALESPV